jgi:hypothetical protein
MPSAISRTLARLPLASPAFFCDTSSISEATSCCWERVWLVQTVEAVAQLDHRVANDGLAAPDVLVNLP